MKNKNQKFSIGDKIYHRGRKQCGIINSYLYCYDDEVNVIFNSEYGEEYARVTESLCELYED